MKQGITRFITGFKKITAKQATSIKWSDSNPIRQMALLTRYELLTFLRYIPLKREDYQIILNNEAIIKIKETKIEIMINAILIHIIVSTITGFLIIWKLNMVSSHTHVLQKPAHEF